MKIKISIIFFIIISCLTISCNDDTVSVYDPDPDPPLSENNFQYPFQLGSFWYYSTRNFVTNLRPDSIGVIYSTDTTVGFGGSVYLKDTVINSDTVRLLSNTHSEPGHEHVTLEYYRQTDSGLIRIASYSDGVNFGPYSANEIHHKYQINGAAFYSVRELIDYYINGDQDNIELIIDDPPITTLKYPIVPDQEWHLKTQGNTEIRKQYTDFETITVGAGTFYCNKVKRKWYYNGTGPDPQIISYDYFSKDGVMKRDLLIKDILVFDSLARPIGYIDVKEETEVLIYTHP